MSTLLIIDDELSALHKLGQIFREHGFTVLTAPSATEGLKLLAQQRPDVVLLDIGLPDQSGFETFQHIRGRDDRIPVIFITGKDTTDTATEAMKMGAYDYLVKPLQLQQLVQLVKRAASMSHLMRIPATAPEEPAPSYAFVAAAR